jgi:hypothetical protein
MEKCSPEAEQENGSDGGDDRGDPNRANQAQAPNISELKPMTREAYGGGLYAAEDTAKSTKEIPHPRASATQSADGPEQQAPKPKHKPPPSTGDRDLDITGQSYIQ